MAGVRGVVLVVAASLVSASCDTGQYSKAVGDFGVATVAVVQQTKAAFRLVNDAQVREEIAAIAESKTDFVGDPAKVLAGFLTDEDLAIRDTLLDGLQAYASALGDLTGKPEENVKAESTKLAAALKSLQKNERLEHTFRETKTVSASSMNGVAAGVEFFAEFLINHRIAKDLPAVLQKTEPVVEGICGLFLHEIGGAPGTKDAGPLRGRLSRAYDKRIEIQVRFVNAKAAGSSEKFEAVARLESLVAEQRRADAALAQTAAALGKVITTHEALLRVGQAPATFKTEIAALFASVQPADEFYSKLPVK